MNGLLTNIVNKQINGLALKYKIAALGTSLESLEEVDQIISTACDVLGRDSGYAFDRIYVDNLLRGWKVF